LGISPPPILIPNLSAVALGVFPPIVFLYISNWTNLFIVLKPHNQLIIRYLWGLNTEYYFVWILTELLAELGLGMPICVSRIALLVVPTASFELHAQLKNT
jgi:hypothetical protein